MSRWEWRTFGSGFTSLDDQFETPPSDVEGSDELYLLSPTGENVKVRDGVLDIKVRRQVDDVGLERWEPVLKAPFPLRNADVAVAFENLRQPVPELGREAYTLDQLLGELVATSTGIRSVPVQKRRARFTIQGCAAERSEFEVGGKTIGTLAVEAEDPGAVWAAVKALGI